MAILRKQEHGVFAMLTPLRIALLGVIAAGACLPQARATVIYDSDSTYLIDAPVSDNVTIDHREARVIVGSGGAISGVDGELGPRGAVRLRTGTLEVTGSGTIVAGQNQSAIDASSGSAEIRLSGQALVHGKIMGETPWPVADESESRMRLYIEDRATVNGNVAFNGYVRIEDQAVILGNVGVGGWGHVNLDIRGGVVVGSVNLGGLDEHAFRMDGGAILGGFHAPPSLIDIEMQGGYIGNGFTSRGALRGEIRGGQIDGGFAVSTDTIPLGPNAIVISGGQFDTNEHQSLFAFASWNRLNLLAGAGYVDIWGGEFGYRQAGSGFFFDELTHITFHGRDLVYSDGWLTGYLMDGNWFSNPLTFGENWRGTFNIHNVPEPGTLGLLLVSLLGLFSVGRRSISRAS